MNAPLRCAIVTISDRAFKGQRPDLSGQALEEQFQALGWILASKKLIPDELPEIRACLQTIVNSNTADVILTTGGTGCSPRDVTPEATLAIIEKSVPGLAEVMRMESIKRNPHGILSRGVAGISSNTLIINLPGSPKGAVENLLVIAAVLPHAVALIHSNPDAEAGHQFAH